MALNATLASWIALTQTPGLGNEGLRRLLKAFGSPDAVLAATQSALGAHVGPRVASAILQTDFLEPIKAVEEWLGDPVNGIVTIGDEGYPEALLNSGDPPLLLYVKGRRELLGHASIAVVGSRNATGQGLRNAEAFARAISDAGYCVVSGLALGIDAAAHEGALLGTGSSIAVVGTGLDRIYPSQNRELAHRLAKFGAIVSEFPLGTPPLAGNFPKRNRIISGLSKGCLVVEASLQSGSLITARLAAEQGREVFAVPGSIHSPQSRGCHALIKQGAKLVESAQDMLEEFRSGDGPTREIKGSDNFLLDQLGFEPTDLDTLSQRSNLTVSELSAILLKLELDGLVAGLPGGLYQRIV